MTSVAQPQQPQRKPNVDYTKFDALAHEEDEEENRKKEADRKKNRDTYFAEQAEKQRKWNEQKRKEAADGKIVPADHGHGHGGPGHMHEHEHKHEHGAAATAPAAGPTPTSHSISRAPSCGCGYVDPDELKRIAAEAKLRPVESQEDKNRKKRMAVEDAKERGNKLFKGGHFHDAISVYQFGVDVIWQAVGMSEAEWPAAEMEAMEVTLTLNIATARLRLGENTECITSCNTALRLDPRNFKAFFRRAEARVAMGDLPQAHEDFTEALKIEPGNKQAVAALANVARLQAEQRAKQRQFALDMSERMRAAASGGASTPAASSSSATSASSTGAK